MPTRHHQSNADRQRAYRERLRLAVDQPAPALVKKPPRRTRPARIATLVHMARELANEYAAWLEAIPENLAGGALAEDLQTAIGQLEEIADIAEAIEPPRIGR